MLFVHVITGLNLFITIAQFEREVQIAFQVYARRNFIEREKREHFGFHLEDDIVGPERTALGRRLLAQTISAEAFGVHFASLAIRINSSAV